MPQRWPLDGLLWFLARPWLWLRPLAVHALALTVLLGVATATTWWAWPADAPWLTFLLRACGAVTLGLVAAIAAWTVLVPLLLALVLDSLAEAVFRARGLPPVAVPVTHSIAAGVGVLLRTLPLRLRWLAVGLSSLLLGPLGPFVAAYALARVAVVDATDIALGVRGLEMDERMALYQRERSELRAAALVAGLLQIGLAFTFVGWLFWMPGLVCGAALRISAGADPSRR